MRWRTANNNRRKAARAWNRTGRWRHLWPGLAETYAKIEGYVFAEMVADGRLAFPMPQSPNFSICDLLDEVKNGLDG